MAPRHSSNWTFLVTQIFIEFSGGAAKFVAVDGSSFDDVDVGTWPELVGVAPLASGAEKTDLEIKTGSKIMTQSGHLSLR